VLRDGDTGRWRVVPNDLDLVLGLRGRTRNRELIPALALGTTSPLFADDRFLQMYHRRLRTLLDTELTAARILGRLDENTAGLAPEIELDRARWQLTTPSLATGRADVADYIAARRALILGHQVEGEVPAAQTSAATAVISEIRASGDPEGDFVELANPSPTEAVDVSGWTLAGAATAELPPGSVVPVGGYLVVPVEPATMAARGEGIAVAGRLDDELPDGGGALSLRDARAAVRDSISWSVDGDWPDPEGGRSIEAVSTRPDRSGPQWWVVSPEPGGTPGTGGASGGRLEVDVWTGRFSAPQGAPMEVRLSVRNHGETALSEVVVTSPRAGCSRDVGTLGPGQTRAWWCTVTPASPRSSEAIVARATSASSHAFDSDSAVVADAGVLTLPRPRGMTVTMAPGGLRGRYQDPAALPPGVPAHPFATWRMEAHLASEGGAAPESRLVPANGTTLTGLAEGVPVSVRVAARSAVAVGTPSARAPGIAPRPSIHWPFASTGALVDAIHRDLLGRPPTTDERGWWVAAIDRFGTPPAQLAADLLALPRWRTAGVLVARLYGAALGRAPDVSGLGYWIDSGRRGTAMSTMANAFARSAEFRRVYGALGDAAFVDRVYRNVLGRAPDASGAAFWAGRLRAGWSRGRVLLGLAESAEGRARLDPAAEVAIAWHALAGAAPSPAVRADAVAWRAVGGSMLTIVDSVRSRDAYAAAHPASG
jgi:hypothetical protein